MMKGKRLLILLKASCFWLGFKLKGVTPIFGLAWLIWTLDEISFLEVLVNSSIPSSWRLLQSIELLL